MRTIKLNLYQFEELSDKAKDKAIEDNRYINTEHDWWQCEIEFFKEMGISIDSFDLYRKNISVRINHPYNTAEKLINNFGAENYLSVLANRFILDWDILVKKYGEGNKISGYSVKSHLWDLFDEKIAFFEDEFKKDISKIILTWLSRENDYLESNQSVEETLICNEYEFKVNGEIY